MATANRFLELLETGEATLEQAFEAIESFEREVMSGRGVETGTCMFCGKPYVITQDKPVLSEEGRRSVCWRRDCRQELRARGLHVAGKSVDRRPIELHLRH